MFAQLYKFTLHVELEKVIKNIEKGTWAKCMKKVSAYVAFCWISRKTSMVEPFGRTGKYHSKSNSDLLEPGPPKVHECATLDCWFYHYYYH